MIGRVGLDAVPRSGRQAVVLLLAFGLLLPARPVTAQPPAAPGAPRLGPELLFLGPRLQDLWTGEGGRLFVHHGLRISAPFTGGATAAETLVTELRPEDEFFDVGLATVAVSREKARIGAQPVDLGGALLRRPVGGLPVRVPLILPGGITVLPGRPRFRVFGWEAAGPRDLDVPLGGRTDLGWGVGDEMVINLVVPHVLARRRAGGGTPDLVVGSDRSYAVHRAGEAAARALKPPPGDDIDGIMDFPHAIRPVLADLDGNGSDDLVLCDPSAGAAVLYLDLDAAAPAPSRVILVGGTLIWAWGGDLDRDGRADLLLLKLPRLSLPTQLSVLREGRVQAEALFYPGQADGTLPASPRLRRGLDLPIEIAIRNEVREARLPALVVPGPGPALLVVRPAGPVEVLPLDEPEVVRSLGTLPPGAAHEPFTAWSLPGGRLAFGWHAATDSRVYAVGPF